MCWSWAAKMITDRERNIIQQRAHGWEGETRTPALTIPPAGVASQRIGLAATPPNNPKLAFKIPACSCTKLIFQASPILRADQKDFVTQGLGKTHTMSASPGRQPRLDGPELFRLLNAFGWDPGLVGHWGKRQAKYGWLGRSSIGCTGTTPHAGAKAPKGLKVDL